MQRGKKAWRRELANQSLLVWLDTSRAAAAAAAWACVYVYIWEQQLLQVRFVMSSSRTLTTGDQQGMGSL